MGKVLIILGIFLVLAGLFLTFNIRIPFIGQLPGDFSYKSENVQIYFPLATSLIFSIILSLLFYLFSK